MATSIECQRIGLAKQAPTYDRLPPALRAIQSGSDATVPARTWQSQIDYCDQCARCCSSQHSSEKLHGGPLGDIGVYCLNAARYCATRNRQRLTQAINRCSLSRSAKALALLWVFQRLVAQCTCNFASAVSRYLRVECERELSNSIRRSVIAANNFGCLHNSKQIAIRWIILRLRWMHSLPQSSTSTDSYTGEEASRI